MINNEYLVLVIKNINKNFDNEYIKNSNKLGELLKYYILITDDNDIEKY